MFDKITEQEVTNAYVQSAPDKLAGSAQENKRIFDRLPLLIIDKFNDFITAITGQSGASDIGAEAIKEGGATNVQGILGELAIEADALAKGKVDAQEGKGLSTNDLTNELKETYNTASERAEVLKDITAIETTVSTSDNKIPTSNAVKKAIDDKVSELGAGDMTKAVYDADGNGVVDDAEKLGGQLPGYYATKAEYIEATLLSSGWSENTYSLEAEYPSETYDVFIYPSKNCTIEQYTALVSAAIASDIEKNILTALGTVPEIDIPVIAKVVKK